MYIYIIQLKFIKLIKIILQVIFIFFLIITTENILHNIAKNT